MVKYDATVLEEYAQRLYDRASWILVVWIVLGLGIGAILGYLPTILWYWRSNDTSPVPSTAPAIVLAVFFGLFFGMIGRAKGFAYRLQAQLALCQMQIEYNTRGSAEKQEKHGGALLSSTVHRD